MIKERKSSAPRSRKFSAKTLTGMHDYLPGDMKYWDGICKILEDLARAYGFGKIILPIAEQTDLFVRSIGESTDIVEKETYSFLDQGGESVTLRPEFTASIARSYIEHGMLNLPQPVKLWTWGPIFRHEKPQAGRYRQFFQFDVESIGSSLPVVDAEIILLTHALLQDLQIDATVHVNSIGCKECRSAYYEILNNFLRNKKKKLCPICQKRVLKSPLRLFDCKEAECQEIMSQAPQLVDSLDSDCHEHFVKVLEHLDESEIPYKLNPRLVRGLDYYTRTVFEFIAPEDEEKRMNTLAAGGRYDGLIEYLGGRPTPACGVAAGIERLIMKMKERKVVPVIRNQPRPQVFLAQLGESARKRALKIFENIRHAGIEINGDLVRPELKTQLFQANKMGVLYTLILGQKEMADHTIILRDMENNSQEIIADSKIILELKKRLSPEAQGVRVQIQRVQNEEPKEADNSEHSAEPKLLESKIPKEIIEEDLAEADK